MKRHLTIKKIDIKNERSSRIAETKIGTHEIDKKFGFKFELELETSGNFEEFWNDKNPNGINLLVLNAILKNMGIDPENPIYKIDL